MANLNIDNILSLDAAGLYKQVGSVRRLQITDVDNIGLNRNPALANNVYDISFRNHTCVYSEDDRKTRAGTYISQKVEAYIPRRRYTVEVMRRKLRDRRIACIVTDWHGNTYVTIGRIYIKFSTGANPGDSNGYNIIIEGADRGKNYILNFVNYTINGEEGYVGGSDFTQESVQIDPPTYSASECCVTIQQQPVAVAPTPTGNVVNLNKMVTTVTGEKYFIDKDGNALMMSNNMIQEVIVGTNSSTYDLTNIVDSSRLFAFRTQNTMIRVDTPQDIHQYNVTNGQLILPNIFPLEVGEYVELVKI